MGNHPKEQQEFVTFELIQDSLGIKDPSIFRYYLTEVFNDLVNSVNHENIKFITMKLDENERSTQIRLMKVKSMMLEKAHHYKEKMA